MSMTPLDPNGFESLIQDMENDPVAMVNLTRARQITGISRYIREAMKGANLSEADLATKAHLSPGQVVWILGNSRLGVTTLEEILRIGAVLNFTLTPTPIPPGSR